jgi:hypothetical protein
MELYDAANQWAARPADQRFASLAAMAAACQAYAERSRVAQVPWASLRVEAAGPALNLTGKTGVPARLTNFAFDQLTRRVGAPPDYLRGLPPTLAAQNLNHGLAQRSDATAAQLLFHRQPRTDTLVLRATTSDVYARLWNWEVVQRLIELSSQFQMVPARQTFTWGGEALPPESQRPPALYASDHDMFAFLMSMDRVVRDPVNGSALLRGLIVRNSEVGDGALSLMGFYFRDMCCNHIIWGAEELVTVRVAHIGAIQDRWRDTVVQVRGYLNRTASLDEQLFASALKRIAKTPEATLERLCAARNELGVTKQLITESFAAINPVEDGDPCTKWSVAQGFTRRSQAMSYTDHRTKLDRAAGKILRMEF